MTTQVSNSTPSIQFPPMERAPGVVVVTLKSEEGKSYKVSVKGPEAFLNDNQKVMEIANELLALAKVYDVGNKTQSLTLKKTENLSTLVQTRAAPKKDGSTVVTHQGQSIEEILTIRRDKLENKLNQLNSQASGPTSQPEKEKLEQKFNRVRQSIAHLSQKKQPPKVEEQEEPLLTKKAKIKPALPEAPILPKRLKVETQQEPVVTLAPEKKVETQKQEPINNKPVVELDLSAYEGNGEEGPLEALVAADFPPASEPPAAPTPPKPPILPVTPAPTQPNSLASTQNSGASSQSKSIQEQLKEKVKNPILKHVPKEKIKDRSEAILDSSKKSSPGNELAQQLAASKAFAALQNANREEDEEEGDTNHSADFN